MHPIVAVYASGAVRAGWELMYLEHEGDVMTRGIALSSVVGLALLVHANTSLGAENTLAWPQFRGPGGSGVADKQRPPVEFGPEKNVKWKVAAPSGLSSPIVVGDKLVITAFEDGKLFTIAYDRGNGKELWRADAEAKEIEKYLKSDGSPAASTPVTDGERIVSYFGSCGLVCYDLSGKQQWKYKLPTATTAGNFGSGVSPILSDGVVVLVRDQMQDARIFGIDATTGELVWEKKRQSPVSYSTPVAWDTPAGKQVAAPGHARMVGYDLKTGNEKWTVAGIPSGCCSSPVTADGILYFAGWSPGGPDDPDPANKMPSFDDMLKRLDGDKDGSLSKAEAEKAFEGFFDAQDQNKDGKVTRDEWDAIIKFMTEGKNVAFALKPGGTGDVSESHVLWRKTRGLPYVPSAIVYRGQYVMVKDGGILTAYDIDSGEEIYQKRAGAPGSYYASPVAANGNIYFVSLSDGVATVIKAGGKEPEVVAQNAALGERVSATPAIADDTLYVRTAGHLYAFADAK